jgi:mono/diheme cytochrome c family protein
MEGSAFRRHAAAAMFAITTLGVVVASVANPGKIVAQARSSEARSPARSSEDGPDLQSFSTKVKPFIKAHCEGCHGARRQRGDLRLDTLDGDLLAGKDAAVWKEVYDRVNRGEMPPKDEPRPPASDIDRLTTWIIGETRKAERAAQSTGGRVILRRMSRAEYANTLRDLLHVRFPFGDGPLELLPPDGTAGGFDKVGSALTIDPSLLSQYLAVARHVADTAIVSGGRPFESRRQRFEFEDTAKSLAIGYECHEPFVSCRQADLALMDGAARTWDHLRLDPTVETTIPASGEYTLRIRMAADVGARGEPLKVELAWPSETVLATWTLGKDQASPRVFDVTVPISLVGKSREGPSLRLVNGTRFYDFNQQFITFHHEADQATNAGDPLKAAKLLALAKAEGAASSLQPNPGIADRSKLPKVILDWIELEGPLVKEWPPTSHRELLFEGRAAKKDLAYARRIFERLMPRAYRRPVTAADVDPIVARVARELDAGEPFEEAIKVGLESLLCSPRFIFLVEPERGPNRRPLDDYELASRLSYFLWSSLPDDELFRLAAAGRLRAPGVLEAQVSRLLRDDRARALVQGFGGQWLQAQKFVTVPPNRQIYKDWDDELEAAVKREPLAFFEEILARDLSVLNFLDSDFAMLNARLARHYGIAGVKGDRFRRVPLPRESHRGGLVTQAAVLTIGSDGTRTLPVRRASWILQTLFNTPPPPPPPNVGEVEPNLNGKRLTVRQRLLQHQKIPACASCHVRIDPYGFALESYDAVGAWRTRQSGEDFGTERTGAPVIDASGTLPDGHTFATTAQFRTLLRGDSDAFSRALAGKMLTYALGRSLESSDRATVADLVAALGAGGYRMSALMTAIAKSPAFQTR